MIDIRVLELLCSRLCHDLISPVGAIRNGLEIIEETVTPSGNSFGDEAMQLIGHAAGQADSRLRLFRLAYGQAGRDVSSFGDARMAAQGWFSSGRTRIEWPAGQPAETAARRRGVVKVLLNLLVLGDEALTHGGTLTVAGTGTQASGEVVVSAHGRPGKLQDELAAALAGNVEAGDLTPRAVHAFITGQFAAFYGFTLEVASDMTGRLDLLFRW